MNFFFAFLPVLVGATEGGCGDEERLPGATLFYFGVRGRGQFPYLVALYAGLPVAFETVAEWPGTLKAQTPFGQLPYLEDGDIKIAQSAAIARYFARKGKMEGENVIDFALSEQLIEEANDIFNLLGKAKKSGDKKAIEEAVSTELPKHVAALEKLIVETGHFTHGEKLTAGDIAVFSVLNLAHGLDLTFLDNARRLKKFYDETLAEPKFQSYFATDTPSFLSR